MTRSPGLLVLLLAAGCVDPPPEPMGEASGPVELEYVAHASFLVRSPAGTEVLLDPYQSRVWLGYDFPDGIEPDAVLVTHPHYDHDAGRFRGAPFPWPDSVPVLDAPGTLQVGEVTVRGVEGKHADPYGEEFGQRNTVMVVEVAGVRIVHLGDNGPLTERMVDEIGRPHVLLIPADDLYHILSPEETEAVIEALRPGLVVPMHHRHPALESEPGSPSDLGELDAWLDGRSPVDSVGHVLALDAAAFPERRWTLVMEPAPYVQPADGAGA